MIYLMVQGREVNRLTSQAQTNQTFSNLDKVKFANLASYPARKCTNILVPLYSNSIQNHERTILTYFICQYPICLLYTLDVKSNHYDTNALAKVLHISARFSGGADPMPRIVPLFWSSAPTKSRNDMLFVSGKWYLRSWLVKA